MFETLRSVLSKVDADYADLRYEVKRETTVGFTGKELVELGSNSTDGFVLRVLDRGGMASAVYTKESDAEDAVRTAVANARLIGSRQETPVELAEVSAVKDEFFPPLGEDPREIGIDEKIDLVRRMNDIPLGSEKVASTQMAYRDVVREKHFVSSEGSEVREDLVTVALSGAIIARDGDLTQDVRAAAGGSDGFQRVRGQEEYFEARTKIALDLLRARPVSGGRRDCVLNPELAGVFAHEAFGHFSEADIIERLPAMREKMQIGARLGSEVVSIVDDATAPGQLGFYRYDDEGVAVRRTPLLTNGALSGRLHSRRTAAAFGEPVSGHHIAEDYRFPPIIRMGCIYIEPGALTEEELLSALGDGLYIVDVKGGQTAGESFTFGAQFGYEVKGGKRGEMVRDLNISGNLYRTLKDIEAVGDDLELCKSGGCGKGQLNIRSCLGGPHVLIRNLLVGGL